jgi:hypothetical protein
MQDGSAVATVERSAATTSPEGTSTMNTTTRRILSTAAAAGVLSIATALPASAEPDWGSPGSTGDPGMPVQTRDVPIDDNAVEYVQIGLGALAGMVVAGAAAVTVRRFGHDAPHPA